jgi:single-stranded DNA-binding protein
MNNFTVSGRIMSTRSFTYSKNGGESNGLSIKLSVNTGQKSKEGEYPPSMIMEVPLWDKLAMMIEEKAIEGNHAVVSGKLAVPTIYTSSDGSKSGVSMAFHYVESIEIFPAPVKSSRTTDSEPAAATQSKSEAKRQSTKAASTPEVEDDIPF